MRFDIKTKLFALVTIPILTLLLFSANYIYEKYNASKEHGKILIYTEFTQLASSLLHELQIERGLSFTLLNSQESIGFDVLLESQRIRTDKKLNDFSKFHTIQSDSDLLKVQKLFIYRIEQELLLLHKIRKETGTKNIQAKRVFDYYTELNYNLIQLIASMRIHSYDEEVQNYSLAMQRLVAIEESAGQERAIVAATLSKEQISPNDIKSFYTLLHTQNEGFTYVNYALKDSPLRDNFYHINSRFTETYLNVVRESLKNYDAKQILLSEISKSIGFGGAIDQLRLYQKSSDSKYLQNFNAYHKKIDQLIYDYSLLTKRNTQEQKLIQELKKLFTVLAEEPKSNLNEKRIYEIYKSLSLIKPHLDVKKWFEVSTERINDLHKFENDMLEKIKERIYIDQETLNRSLAYQVAATLITISLLLLGSLLFLYRINRSISALHGGVQSFFDYLNFKKSHIDPIEVVTEDELGDIIKSINNQIVITHNNLEQDQDFINETTQIVTMMKEGDFSEKPYYEPKNPNLIDLKKVFLELTHLINNKIKEQTKELEELNVSLEEKVFEQTLELQERLQELSEFKKAINNAMYVIEFDENFIPTFANGALTEALEIKQSEFNEYFHTVLINEETADIRNRMQNAVKSLQSMSEVVALSTKMGDVISFNTTVTPILDTHNRVTKILAILNDISPIIAARDKAIEAEKAKDEFLANMSHEIRTPLNAILGFVTILKKRILDEKSKSYLDIIDTSGKSLLSIINDILDFSKIQSGKFTISPQQTNIVDELSTTTLLFASKAYEKHLLYSVYIDPKMPAAINIDSVRVKQILSNLLSNAMKFTNDDGEVKVKATLMKGLLTIVVQDSGIGIAKEFQNKIFTAFEQADGSTTRKYGGTGLGLSISAKLTQLMNGTLTLKSKEGEGSTFTLTIPVETTMNRSQELIDKALIADKRFLILDINENSSKSRLIKRYLEDFGAQHIDTTTTYHDAKEYDVLFFAPDDSYNEEIVNSAKPAIAMLRTSSVKLANLDHIAPLYAPFVPKAIIEALEDINLAALASPSSISSQVHATEQLTRFEGHILVAEDNKTNQLLISLILDEFGLSYDIADNGLEAVDLFKSNSYDLVLMDENMPELNGIGAMQRIKAYEEKNSLILTPIIALTASVLESDKVRFTEAGMDGFVGKPINNRELEAELAKHLTKKEI